MGHIWDAVVTLWLPRDQRELWAWPGGAGNMVPRTEGLSPRRGGANHPGSLPGWRDSPKVGTLQGKEGSGGWKGGDSETGDPLRSHSISAVSPEPHSGTCHLPGIRIHNDEH